MTSCIHCLKETSNPKFCSKSCAAKYNNLNRPPRSAESRKRTSLTLKGRPNPHARNPDLHPKWCLIKYHPCNNCGKLISKPRKLTCSIECRDQIRSKNGTLKKRIEYNGCWFQSSWEVKIAIFLDEMKVIWEQPHKRFHWYDISLERNRTYLPDFYLPRYNFYLDVKNPKKQMEDADKIKQLIAQFPLFVGDIQKVKQFVARLAGLEPACIH